MSVPYRLLIVGAGGFGRELHCLTLMDAPALKLEAEWTFGGFLDANPAALANFDSSLPILDDPLHFTPDANDRFVCALGDPETKLEICRHLKSLGAIFATLISSCAHIGRRCQLGEGCVLVHNTQLTTDVKLGNFVTLNVSSGAGHDVVIGDGGTLSAHCDVTGGAQLGEGVFLGSHASITPGVKIGDYARIGAGSAVIRDVPPYTTVMGVPAKVIFSRPPKSGT